MFYENGREQCKTQVTLNIQAIREMLASDSHDEFFVAEASFWIWRLYFK